MKKFFNYIGYDQSRDFKLNFTYLVSFVVIVVTLLYGLSFLMLFDNPWIIFTSFLCTLSGIVAIILLKNGRCFSARLVVTLGIIEQILFLVFVFFPITTAMFLYLFLIPPIIYLFYDIKKPRERITLFIFCILTILFTIISGLYPYESVLSVSESNIIFYREINLLVVSVLFIVNYYRYTLAIDTLTNDLRILAHTDPLTNTTNRRKLFELGEQLMEVSDKYSLPYGLILVDIDFFKQINDTYGHPSGDAVLVQLTELLKTHIRKDDILSRYGGEEFVIILKNTDAESLIEIGNHLLSEVAEYRFSTIENHPLTLTVSEGLVFFDTSRFKNFDEVIIAADKALYTAKENGRNRAVIFQTD
jgi:diguanylate cyclase (GGDEF)-like protein